MSKDSVSRSAALAALVIVAVAGLAGCENKGPAEQAGQSVDKGVQNLKDAVTPAGPVEKAGRGVDKVLGK